MKKRLCPSLFFCLFFFFLSEVAVSEVKVLSMNLWYGGSRVSDGVKKIERVVNQYSPDVVAFQEENGALEESSLSKSYFYKSAANKGGKGNWGTAVLSRWPILYSDFSEHSTIIKVRPPTGPTFVFVSVHLSAYPYSPYLACFDHASSEEILRKEKFRSVEMKKIVEKVESVTQDNSSVILAGDFNTPSHLDWSNASSDHHCQRTISFPVSLFLKERDFKDSFRTIYPNASTHLGNTWSPIIPFNNDSNREEPQDRIDRIYSKGSFRAVKSQVIFEKEIWPSDHAAVLSSFKEN